MFNLADLIVIIVVGLSSFISYKKGFTKTFIKLISFFVAIILALLLYKPVAVFLKENTGIDEWIITKVVKIGSDKEEFNEAQKDESIRQNINNLPQNIKESLGVEKLKEQAIDVVTDNLVNSVLNIIAMIGIYVVTRLGLMILCFVLDEIMQIPVLKQINEILGLILGAFLGVIQIYTVCSIVTFLAQIADISFVVDYINSSILANFFYNNNLLIAFIF